jgi:hypothetical protein
MTRQADPGRVQSQPVEHVVIFDEGRRRLLADAIEQYEDGLLAEVEAVSEDDVISRRDAANHFAFAALLLNSAG